MSPKPNALPGSVKSKAFARWEATHRVVFDTDQDGGDDTPVSQSDRTGSTVNAQSLVTLPVKPMRCESQRGCKPYIYESLINDEQPHLFRSQQPAHRSRGPVQQTRLDDSISSTKTTGPAKSNEPIRTNVALDDLKDQWITCEPDRSSNWHEGNHGKWGKLLDGRWGFQCTRKQPQRPNCHRQNKSRTTFQNLPPEIRNVVYRYIVPECNVLIVRNRPNKEMQTLKKTWSEEMTLRERPRARLMHQPECDHVSEGFENSINLLVTCKTIRQEVETYIYSRTFFHFFTLKDLRKFLSTASKSGIASIRRVFIRQDGYGNPELTDQHECRKRYYDGWDKTCAQFGQMTPHLRHLKLAVYDREWPCVLSGKDFCPAWSRSMLKLAPGLLPQVEVRIHHRMIDKNQEVLNDLAHRIEDRMMTQAGRDERDCRETQAAMVQIAARKHARIERERQKKVKLEALPPPTELLIGMEDVANHGANKATATKLRTKGLDKFHRLDTVTGVDVWMVAHSP